MRVAFAAVAALGLVSGAAVADDKKTDTKDPNRIICEKQDVVGSRLVTKRICMTAAEWQAKRLEERQAVEKTQMLRGTTGN